MGMMEFHRHIISQLHDAQMDMIVKLNKFTDLECPDCDDFQIMRDLSKSIEDLQKTINMIEELDDKEEEEMEEEIMARAKSHCDAKMAHAHSMEHMASKISPA